MSQDKPPVVEFYAETAHRDAGRELQPDELPRSLRPAAEFIVTLKLRLVPDLTAGTARRLFIAELAKQWAAEDAVVLACEALHASPLVLPQHCNHVALHPMTYNDSTVCLHCGSHVAVIQRHFANGEAPGMQASALREKLDALLASLCETSAQDFPVAVPAAILRPGQRVRFLMDNLGASERDDLRHFVRDTYGSDDEGVVSFQHPNQNGKPMNCKGWWYIEVDSKVGPPRKLYVGVPPHFVTVLP